MEVSLDGTAAQLIEPSADKSFAEKKELAFGKLPIGVEVMEALKNKRCLRAAIGVPSSFVLAEETDTQVIFRQP